ncbi:MAG: hypothetical protein HXS43_08610 [Theionarchaea archaeon]|nr:hypothetical protein [Theionarchaea archaeon]
MNVFPRLWIVLLLLLTAACVTIPASPQPDINEQTDTSQPPIQSLHRGDPIILHTRERAVSLIPVATYEARVLVVSTAHYIDEDSDIAPLDFCVVWGELSQDQYLEYATFNQTNRVCICTYEADSPVDNPLVLTAFVNIHLIPANQNILTALYTVRKGQKIILEGLLVDVYYEGSLYIKTSTSLTDKGTGACEVLYVTRIQVGTTIYQ